MTSLFRKPWEWFQRLRSRRLVPGALRHDGLVRSYLLYMPRHLQGRKLPLVVVLHGGASSPDAIARTSRMHAIAEREGFIVAYPAGVRGPRGLTWNPGGGQGYRRDTDDAGFIRALLVELQQLCTIDVDRVYVAGMSIGGSLAYRLACAASEQLAAIGVVAGTMTGGTCDPHYPVAVIHIHGTDDQRVPLRGGRGRRTAAHNEWPSVYLAIERWREINGCKAPPQTIRLVEGVVGQRSTGDADVELWLVEGGRHVWPGAPARGRSRHEGRFSASEKIWNFFAAHPRPSE